MSIFAALLFCILMTLPAPNASAAPVRVEPRETAELFANPGMGWQTFHRFSDTDPALQGLPSGSAYFRFYWREIEPADGAIDFARLDEMLAHGRRTGQKVALRLMCIGSDDYADSPLWLRDAGCKGTEVMYDGRKHWYPDFTDAVFREKHGRLVRELGKRYDGHPALDTIDIGTVGRWAEWHMWGITDPATGQKVPMPPAAVQQEIISQWSTAFPRTPKVVLIGSSVAMERAVKDGLGWRADCLGNRTKPWNEMEMFYPQAIAKAGAEDAWKRAPVAFESCWDMRKWQAEGWDARATFDYALAQHASYINNKSAPLPDKALPEVERLLRKLGYRLVLRSLEHAPTAKRGQALTVKLDWENVGVAPPYFDSQVALRLTPAGGRPLVFVSTESMRGFLPGSRSQTVSFPLPGYLMLGEYELAIGLVEPAGGKPAVRLAIEGRDAEGWYPLSRVQITRR